MRSLWRKKEAIELVYRRFLNHKGHKGRRMRFEAEDFLGVTSRPSWFESKETCTLSEHGRDHSKSRSKRLATTSNRGQIALSAKFTSCSRAYPKRIGCGFI